MKEMAARDARNRFGLLLDASQRAPVLLTRQGRGVSVMMSVEEYERLRGAAWEGLAAAMNDLGEEAAWNSLTSPLLGELLADES